MRLLLAGDIRAVHLQRFKQYFVNKGHDVVVASAESDPHFNADYRLETLSKPAFLKYLFALPSFKKAINDFKPEVLNCHFVPNYGFLGMMSGFRPLAVSIWGSDILISPKKSFLHKMRAVRILRSADLLISDACMLTDKAHDLAGKKINIITVPYGVPEKIVNLSHSKAIKHKSRLRIISTRRLEKLYRVGDFIHALKDISSDINCDALIIGDGSQMKHLQNLKTRLKLDKLNFLGALEHDNLLDILPGCDIYVSCSESDSTSVSLLEAMACRLFPVVSDIAGNREWITDGLNGFLFPVGDVSRLAEKIRIASHDLELRRKAAEYNIQMIKDKAVWENNMAVIEKELIRLVG